MTTTLGFTVHVLLGVTPDGVTDEATREFPTWADACEAVSMVPDQLMSQGRGWEAITIFPTENFPRVMQGAAPVGKGSQQAGEPRG